MSQQFDPTTVDYVLRTDLPTKIIYFDKGQAIMKNEMFLVCKRNGSQEIVIQSDRDENRAQISVDILNAHEENNARNPVFYWRPRRKMEHI
jgi:hypothetical protein